MDIIFQHFHHDFHVFFDGCRLQLQIRLGGAVQREERKARAPQEGAERCLGPQATPGRETSGGYWGGEVVEFLKFFPIPYDVWSFWGFLFEGGHVWVTLFRFRAFRALANETNLLKMRFLKLLKLQIGIWIVEPGASSCECITTLAHESCWNPSILVVRWGGDSPEEGMETTWGRLRLLRGHTKHIGLKKIES